MTLQTAALGEFHDLRMPLITSPRSRRRQRPTDTYPSVTLPGYLIGWRTRVGPGLPAGLWPWLLIVYRAWAAASWVIAAISSSLMRRPTPAVTAATPVVLMLISFDHLESTYLERLQQPSSHALTLLTGRSPCLNTHNKRTRVCRFVRGIPVGIDRRVADLWGFCGARKSPLTCLAQPTRAPRYSSLWVLVITLRITHGYRAEYQPGGNSAPCRLFALTGGRFGAVTGEPIVCYVRLIRACPVSGPSCTCSCRFVAPFASGRWSWQEMRPI